MDSLKTGFPQIRRIELKISKHSNGHVTSIMGFLPHSYPNPVQYFEGVDLVSIVVERENPQAKVKNTEARAKANQLLTESGAYEALLVNQQGWVTEGSRSNIFMIKNQTVYSAPDEMILSGISRLHVLEVMQLLDIPFKKEPFTLERIYHAEAVILCGTSPGVIPVRRIDSIKYPTQHELVKRIMIGFNDRVTNYLAKS